MLGGKPLVSIVALSLAALLFSVWLNDTRAESPTPWPTKQWLTSTPEEQGMDASELAALVAFGEAHSFDSLLVVRHGRIVTEAYYAPFTADVPHEIYSATKSFTGTLVGMAYKDGLLDRLDHPMLDFFADRQIADVDERKKAITVQNLLDMTSGFDWSQGFEGGKEQTRVEMDHSANWTQFVLDRPMAHAPGEVYNYSNGDPHLLSAIITKLTGKAAGDYAKEKLFDPLGITTWTWSRDPQGFTRGADYLSLLTRDMAKFGYLYLRHGVWEGQRLLPEGWADVMNHATVNMHATYDPNQRYSDLFWVFPGGRTFMANGLRGQNIAVFPELDIVVVVTARRYVSQFALIEGVYAAVKSEAALAPNPKGAAWLANAIKDAATEKPTPVGPTPVLVSAISGKVYKFADNEFGLSALTLFLTVSDPHVEYEIHTRNPDNPLIKYDNPIGLDGLYRGGAPIVSNDKVRRIPIAKGNWLDAQTFRIDSQDLGYGAQRKILLSFSGRKLNLRRTDEDGREVSVDGEQGE
jgi:CubicO group peptidase (beta-lactamase class C family)